MRRSRAIAQLAWIEALKSNLAPLLPATARAQQTTQSRLGRQHQKTCYPLELPSAKPFFFAS
jgi:hypothetical protein